MDVVAKESFLISMFSSRQSLFLREALGSSKKDRFFREVHLMIHLASRPNMYFIYEDTFINV